MGLGKKTFQRRNSTSNADLSGRKATKEKKSVPVLQKAEQEEELQMKASPVQLAGQNEEMQLKKNPNQDKENKTGMPDNLKSGIENLSGMNMDHVRVHYNSSQPAQLNALAYAQGSDIHVAPGQEKHLPHEAWHVVQQAQGRVQPTTQMKTGVAVNDDPGLEHEADVMGEKALTLDFNRSKKEVTSLMQLKASEDEKQVQLKQNGSVVQFGFLDWLSGNKGPTKKELQTKDAEWKKKLKEKQAQLKSEVLKEDDKWLKTHKIVSNRPDSDEEKLICREIKIIVDEIDAIYKKLNPESADLSAVFAAHDRADEDWKKTAGASIAAYKQTMLDRKK